MADAVTELRHQMKEKLEWDQKEKQKDLKKGQEYAAKSDLEKIQELCPGEQIYFCGVSLRCPSRGCARNYGVAQFFSKAMGEQFHVRCSCGGFITLRDTEKILGTNNFPVKMIQEAMRDQPGKYIEWINMLKAAYEAMGKAYEKVRAEGRERTHDVLPEGKNGRSPIRLRMTVQTPEEALEEMKVVKTPTSKTHHLTSTTKDQVEELFADPDVAGKY